MPLQYKLFTIGLLLIISLACAQNSIPPTPINQPTSAPKNYSLEELCSGLRTILPKDWEFAGYTSLESAGDAGAECVIFYHFDIINESQTEAPIRGVVYHPNDKRPPCLTPYSLIPREGGHLCTHKCIASMKDVISGFPGKELIIEDRVGEGSKQTTIFRWNSVGESGEEYIPLGHFSGDQVLTKKDVVTVIKRHADRPQLATEYTYYPYGKKNYYNANAPEPIKKIVFWQSEPKQVALSPYPEKVVLAFYTNYTNGEEPSRFLGEENWTLLDRCNNNQCGCNIPREQIEEVRVLELIPLSSDCSPDTMEQCKTCCPDQVKVQATILCESRSCGQSCQENQVIWNLKRIDAHWVLESMTLDYSSK